LIAGREFNEGDTASAPKVAVVNEAFVHQFFPGRDPIGRRIGQDERSAPDIEIVGVVKNAKYSSVREEIPPVFYTPYRQLPRQSQLYFYIRTAIDPQQLIPMLRREVASLDSNLPIQGMKTMEVQITEGLYSERLLSLLTGLFAFLATLIAAVGLYGVLSFNVARRTREIGICSALGAGRATILRMVVGQGLKVALVGIGIGMAASVFVTRVMASLLYGVSATDSTTFFAVALIVLCIAGLASYIPARRAARVDPIRALRAE
jgi:predicted permease